MRESQRLDPDFCRVHYQLAHIFVQQNRYLDMEGELLEAILCPTTASHAIGLWNNYWQSMVQADPTAEERRLVLTRKIWALQQNGAKGQVQTNVNSLTDEL